MIGDGPFEQAVSSLTSTKRQWPGECLISIEGGAVKQRKIQPWLTGWEVLVFSVPRQKATWAFCVDKECHICKEWALR